MRVLVVTNMYPPHHLGGYELWCRDVVRRFRQNGHHVEVLTSTIRLAAGDPGEEDGVRRGLQAYWEDHRLLRPPWRERLAMERHNQAALAAALEALRPDVVSCWNLGALSMGLLSSVLERRLPTVLVVCDDWLVTGPLLDPWTADLRRVPGAAAAARRLAGVPSAVPDYDRASAVCFVSESVRRTARDHTCCTFARSTVIGSGIATSEFPPPAASEAAGPWEGRLLFVGRVEHRKGIATAVRALARLPEGRRLEVIGPADPWHRAELEDLARDLGVLGRVQFDVVPRSALRQRYLGADALLFPSEWAEPFGLVPLEAMACGRPVVATGTGGSGEFLADGVNCVLVPPGDDAALAAAVERLADDAVLRARLVAGGLETAARYDVDRLADELEAVHRSVLG